MPKQHTSGHGGNRKVGRNKIKCQIYRQQDRRRKNKVKKLLKVCKRQPNNKQVANRLKELQ